MHKAHNVVCLKDLCELASLFLSHFLFSALEVGMVFILVAIRKKHVEQDGISGYRQRETKVVPSSFAYFAVLRADLNVRVASTSASPGNPALLRCETSRAAREYVDVKERTMDGVKVGAAAGHRGKTET